MTKPLESGVVKAIHVHDGQVVKEGDVLIEIDSTINEAERDRIQKEYTEGQLNAVRLHAALNMADDPEKDFTAPQDATEIQIANQKNLLLNQVREIRAKLDGLDQQIAQQQGNLAAVQSTINKLTQSIPYLEQRAKARDTLAKQGYGSKLDYLTTQQDLVEHQQELQVQQGKLAEATAAVSSLQQQRKQAEAEWKGKILNELTQTEQKTASLKEQLVQASKKFNLQTLTAPVDGTVQQLSVHTEGGVVTLAQALMSIVPADAHIEIESMVSNRDIGFVHAGEDAEVKVDTFNFTKYGLMHGHVVSISQDAITHEKPADHNSDKRQAGAESDSSEPNGQELVYMAGVALDETQMWVDDRLVSLTPGMAVTVEIKTGSRHIISYLMSPIQKHMHQALRER